MRQRELDSKLVDGTRAGVSGRLVPVASHSHGTMLGEWAGLQWQWATPRRSGDGRGLGR